MQAIVAHEAWKVGSSSDRNGPVNCCSHSELEANWATCQKSILSGTQSAGAGATASQATRWTKAKMGTNCASSSGHYITKGSDMIVTLASFCQVVHRKCCPNWKRVAKSDNRNERNHTTPTVLAAIYRTHRDIHHDYIFHIQAQHRRARC